jgi:hypothetical protein
MIGWQVAASALFAALHRLVAVLFRRRAAKGFSAALSAR